MKYLQNEARKQKSVKEVTLQLSMIFQIRLKNNTVNFRDICPLNKSGSLPELLKLDNRITGNKLNAGLLV
jgi:hypothetical protein